MKTENKCFSLSKILCWMISFLILTEITAQSVPGKDENIPYLATFSKQGETKWGDNDFVQTWFFLVPKEMQKPFYIRVFDPDVCGTIDEIKNECDSKTKFSIYGGKGAYSNTQNTKMADITQKSGTLLASKTFGKSSEYDGKWFTFGPFNPSEGESVNSFESYVFRVDANGMDGNDGNLYKYFMSKSSEENIEIEGGNVFTYEYTFRMHEKSGSVSHIYPFLTEDVTAVKISVFDLDDDCYMRLVSVSKKGEKINGSKDDEWSESVHKIGIDEKKTSLDIQIIKFKDKPNNNIVIAITNQYGVSLPFYSVPIGGVPKYKYKIGIKD